MAKGGTTNLEAVYEYAEPVTENGLEIDTVEGDWLVGQVHHARLAVVNAGPSGEYGPVRIEVPVPSGASLLDATGDGWTCHQGRDDDGAEVLACDLGRGGVDYGEPLVPAGGTSPALDVSVVPAGSGEVELAARVRGATDPVWHRATATFAVQPRVGLALAIDAVDELTAGDDVDVAVTVSNAGPSASVDPPAVALAIPDGWSFDGVDDARWTCTVDGTIDCRRDTPLASGESSTVTLRLHTPADAESGEATLTATLVADPGEIDPLDDLDDVDVYVHAATAESTASGDSSTTTEPPATATSGVEAPTHPVRGADLAGYGGAAGAFAFGALLLSGRRRRGW